MTQLTPIPPLALPVQASPAAASPVAAPSVPPGSKVSRPSQPVDQAKLAKSAHEFEAMAIGQLLEPMFDTVDLSKDPFGGGAGEAAWKPMLVQEFAKQIEAHGGLGLARPIYDAMLRMQENNTK
jgi:Rod binding domain-containing protein